MAVHQSNRKNQHVLLQGLSVYAGETMHLIAYGRKTVCRVRRRGEEMWYVVQNYRLWYLYE